MALASIWKKSAALRSTSDRGRTHRESGLAAFAVALLALALLSHVLFARGAGGVALFDASSLASPRGLGFPYVAFIAWLQAQAGEGWALPLHPGQIVALVLDALFLSLLWRDVARFAGRTWATALTALVAVNPMFLLTIAVGGTQAVGLLAFYALGRTLRRLQGRVEAFTYLRVSGTLCALLCIDLQTLTVAAVVAPWLLLVMPADVRRKAPGSFFLVCYLPAMFLLGMWAYVNLTVYGGAWPTLGALLDSGVLLPPPFAREAGMWPAPLRWGLAAAAGAPVLLLSLRSRTPSMARATLAGLGTVASAALLAWALGWAFYDYLPLLFVPVALLLRVLRPGQRWQAAALLVLGAVGASWVYPQALPLPTWSVPAAAPDAVDGAAVDGQVAASLRPAGSPQGALAAAAPAASATRGAGTDIANAAPAAVACAGASPQTQGAAGPCSTAF